MSDTRKQHIIKSLTELINRIENTNTADEFFSMHLGSKEIEPTSPNEQGMRWRQYERTREYRVELSWKEVDEKTEVCPRCRIPMIEEDDRNHKGEKVFHCTNCLCMMTLADNDKKGEA